MGIHNIVGASVGRTEETLATLLVSIYELEKQMLELVLGGKLRDVSFFHCRYPTQLNLQTGLVVQNKSKFVLLG